MKKCLFGGYNKDDVIKYISELNEEHSIELNAKSDMYNDLKSDTDTKVLELSNKNKHSSAEIGKITLPYSSHGNSSEWIYIGLSDVIILACLSTPTPKDIFFIGSNKALKI